MLLAMRSALAGGPFEVDAVSDSGVAQQWEGNELKWSSEDGDLAGTVNNATAIQWVNDAISKWTGAALRDATMSYPKTVDVKATWQGSVGKDVNETNYLDYNNSSDGPTVIIFDKGGTITKAETEAFDPNQYQYIPGLTQLLLSDSSGKKIKKGIVIFNGALLESSNAVTLTPNQFKAAVQHEIGHLFNLDHSQVNLEIANACDLGGSCPDAQYIPTMFPELKTERQGTELKVDDKVTISWIYPNTTFQNSFCTITGEIQDKDGRPLQGVNVFARRVDSDAMKKEEVRAMVSGVLYPPCFNDGHYYLYGIVPGRTYEVMYEQLSPLYTGMSGFEPLKNPPSGFPTENISASDDSTTVSCSSGGQTIAMQTVQVPVTNPCPAPTEKTTSSGSGGSGGGCSLIPAIFTSPL
jgi:hypothetical protein